MYIYIYIFIGIHTHISYRYIYIMYIYYTCTLFFMTLAVFGLQNPTQVQVSDKRIYMYESCIYT